ncbi:MAG TPA: hypothetical protein VFK88_01810 [Gallionella sp.]|nr:hypothetical protein [Gallionella sp.]
MTRLFTHFGRLLAIGLLIASGFAQADDWITHYYEHPTPERFVAEVQKLREAGSLAKPESAAPVAAFLARVMATNPARVEGWLTQLNGLKGADRDTLLYAANLSGTPEALAYLRKQADARRYLQKQVDLRTVEPVDGAILDMLWGDFFASGDPTPIRRIVYALNYEKYSGALSRYETSKKTEQDREEANREAAFEAARWSLESNIQQHRRVGEIIEQVYWNEQITPSERLWLSAILAKNFPEKYEFSQVQSGEWAFRKRQ